MTKSKKYSTQQKLLKARDNPKIFKKYSPLLHLGNAQHMESQNARIKDVEYAI